MAIFDFLGGGAFTFVIVLVALFILWGLYKLILAPIFRLFGWGRKTMGELGDYASKRAIDSFFHSNRESDRAQNESATEGQLGKHLEQERQVVDAMDGLAKNIESTQDFNEDKLREFQSLLDTERGLVKEDAAAYHAFLSQYNKDKRDSRKVIKDVKNEISAQEQIRQAALARAEIIQKHGQSDPYEGRIIEICGRIVNFSKEIETQEQQEKNSLEDLIQITKNRETVLKQIKGSVDEIEKALKREPRLQQMPIIEQHLETMKRQRDQLTALFNEARTIVQNRQALTTSIAQRAAQINDSVQEQQRLIHQSEALHATLIAQGAIPKKAA